MLLTMEIYYFYRNLCNSVKRFWTAHAFIKIQYRLIVLKIILFIVAAIIALIMNIEKF